MLSGTGQHRHTIAWPSSPASRMEWTSHCEARQEAVSSLLVCVPYFGVESKTILPAVNGAHEVVQCAAPIAVHDSLNTHWHGRDNQTLGDLLGFFFSCEI